MLFIKGLANSLHILSAIVWIGGMFFAYVALRPAAAALEPEQRLTLWARTFSGFFPWVFVSVILLFATGGFLIAYYKIFMTTSLHIMVGLATVMTLMFLHVYFAPFKRLKQNVIIKDWAAAGKNLAQIRMLIGMNLSIGLLLIVAVVIGRQI